MPWNLDMKTKITTLIMAAAMSFFAFQTADAQSQSFKLGQWTEIHNSIIKELNRSYVDTLPIDRIMRVAVDAMLEELDPYTVYIPEEENEDLQMMMSNTYGGIGAIIHKKKEDNVIIKLQNISKKFEDDVIFFNMSEGSLICKDCTDSLDGLTPLDRTSLSALRHIAYSEFSKLYSFSVPEKSAVALSKITEKYLTLQIDYKFSTLDFYHSIINY